MPQNHWWMSKIVQVPIICNQSRHLQPSSLQHPAALRAEHLGQGTAIMTEVIQRSSRPVGTTAMGCMKSSFKKVGTLCLQSDFKYPFKLVLSLPHIATYCHIHVALVANEWRYCFGVNPNCIYLNELCSNSRGATTGDQRLAYTCLRLDDPKDSTGPVRSSTADRLEKLDSPNHSVQLLSASGTSVFWILNCMGRARQAHSKVGFVIQVLQVGTGKNPPKFQAGQNFSQAAQPKIHKHPTTEPTQEKNTEMSWSILKLFLPLMKK